MPTLTLNVASSAGNSYDLTALGTADWFVYPNSTTAVKKNVSNILTNAHVGSFSDVAFSGTTTTLIWSDGAVTPSGTTDGGEYSNSSVNGVGYEITAPADTSLRTIKVFAGIYRGTLSVSVSISDGSTSTQTDSSIVNSSGNASQAVISVDYSAASAGQTVTVTITGTSMSGNINLQGAAVTTPASSGTNITPGVGSIAITGYAPTIAQTGSQTISPGVGSLAITGYSPNIAQSVNFTSGITFSPGNWDIAGNSAKTINAGAYFKTIFGGTTCVLNFDMSTALTPYPQIWYRIDGFGAWTAVAIAATVTLTLPTETSDYANKPGHLLEVIVKSTTQTNDRWSLAQTMIKLTGITLDSGKTLSTVPTLPLNLLYYGDSITEGWETENGTGANDTLRNDAAQGWAYHSAKMLGAEVGIVGFNAQGFVTIGMGGVPVFTSSYNYLYSGVARSFSPAPDGIIINMGTNDTSSITTAGTTILNALLAATPSTTKIIVLRPFNGNRDSDLVSAIAACNTPSRCIHVDTTGFFTTANSYDGLHPYGIENITHIAPLVANAIRPYIVTASIKPTTTKTVSYILKNKAGTLQTNLSNLNWEWMDMYGVVIDSGTNAATDGVGAGSLTVHTNLVSAATGYLNITDSTGTPNVTYKAFFGPVAVT